MADQDYLPSLATNEVSAYDIRTAAARVRIGTAVNQCANTPNYTTFAPNTSHETFKPPPEEADDIPAMSSVDVGYYDGITAQKRTSRANSESDFRDGLADYADYIVSAGGSYTVPARSVPSVSVIDDENPDRMASNVVGAYDSVLGGYSTSRASSASRATSQKSSFDDYMESAEAKFDLLSEDADTVGSIANTGKHIKTMYGIRYTRTDSSVTDPDRMSLREALNSNDAAMRKSATDANSDITAQYNAAATRVSNQIYDPTTGEGMNSRIAARLIHATDDSGQDLPTG